MNRKTHAVLAASVMLSAALLAGCGENPEQTTPPTEQILQSEPAVTQTTEVPETETVPETSEPTFEIETPYCAFNFPEKWKDEVRIEHLEGTPYTVAFYARLSAESSKEQHIFDLVFETEKENALGTILTENGEVYVAVNPYSFENMDEMSDAELDRMMELQDYSMDILQLLTEFYGFEFVN